MPVRILGGGGSSEKVTIDGEKVTEKMNLVEKRRHVAVPISYSDSMEKGIGQGNSFLMYNNDIHALGGANTNISNSLYKYKKETNTWETVCDLPYSINEFPNCEVLNNELHILGGGSSSSYYRSHYKWNGTSWKSVSTLPYYVTRGKQCVVYQNNLHLLGSKYSSSYGQYHYMWNGSSWTNVSTIPVKLYMGNSIVYNNEIHIITSDQTNSTTSMHYAWNGSSWRKICDLPFVTLSGVASLVVYHDKLHLFLFSYTQNDITTHYIFDGTRWIEGGQTPILGDYWLDSCVFENDIWCIDSTYDEYATCRTSIYIIDKKVYEEA